MLVGTAAQEGIYRSYYLTTMLILPRTSLPAQIYLQLILATDSTDIPSAFVADIKRRGSHMLLILLYKTFQP